MGSEAETAAVANFLWARQTAAAKNSKYSHGVISVWPGHIAAFLDYHTFARMILPPWAHTNRLPRDEAYQTQLATAMSSAIGGVGQYQVGSNLFDPDPGTAPDWAYGVLGVRASMTLELDPGFSDYDPGFCYPSSGIRQVGGRQWAALKALTKFLDDNGDEPSSCVGVFASLVVSADGTAFQGTSSDAPCPTISSMSLTETSTSGARSLNISLVSSAFF